MQSFKSRKSLQKNLMSMRNISVTKENRYLSKMQLPSEKGRIFDQDSNTGTLNSVREKDSIGKRRTLHNTHLDALNIPRRPSFIGKKKPDKWQKAKSRRKNKNQIKLNPQFMKKHKLFTKDRHKSNTRQDKLINIKKKFLKTQSKMSIYKRRNNSTVRNHLTLEGIRGKSRRFKSPDIFNKTFNNFDRNTSRVSPISPDATFLSRTKDNRHLKNSRDQMLTNNVRHVKTKMEEQKLPSIKKIRKGKKNFRKLVL